MRSDALNCVRFSGDGPSPNYSRAPRLSAATLFAVPCSAPFHFHLAHAYAAFYAASRRRSVTARLRLYSSLILLWSANPARILSLNRAHHLGVRNGPRTKSKCHESLIYNFARACYCFTYAHCGMPPR
jgi:hypothetical protein